MAVYQNLSEAIQQVQTNMSNMTTVNDPGNYSKLTGTMNWLFSPENGKTIQTEMNKTAAGSKYRSVGIRYLPKKGTGQVITSDASGSCTKANTRREIVQTVNADLYVEDKFSIEEEVIREGTLEQLTARLTKEIRDAQRNCREDMNRQLLAAYASNIGANPAAHDRNNFLGGVGTYTDVEMLLSNGAVSVNNFDVIKLDQEDNFMTGTIGILGLGNARKYMNRLAVGNVNDSGADVSEIASQFGMALFKDHYTTSVLGGADRVIASYAGLSQFFNYNVFKGDFALNTPDLSIRTTIRDAIFPFEWDYILKYDDECDTGNGLQGAWTGRILCYFNLWIAPDTAFGEPYGDLADFNGVVGYNVTQAS